MVVASRQAVDEDGHSMDVNLGVGGCAALGRSRAQQRRDKVVDVARRLFASQGFHATGMAQIAKESGVAVGQIYRRRNRGGRLRTVRGRGNPTSRLGRPRSVGGAELDQPFRRSP